MSSNTLRVKWVRVGIPWRSVVLVLAAFALACTPPPAGDVDAAARNGDSAQSIRHLVPIRDSVGDVPSRFEWTAVDGADRYAIGIWNEPDRLVWREDGLRVPSVLRPETLELESGTYFWSVSAMRDDQQVASSGLSAFVVLR